MDEKTFKKLLAEQTKVITQEMDKRFSAQDNRIDTRFVEQDKNIAKTMDTRFAEQSKGLVKTMDDRFVEQNKKVDKRFKEQETTIDTQLEEQDILMQQYVGALGENYQASLKAALEVYTPLLVLPEKVRNLEETLQEVKQVGEITLEHVAQLTENQTVTNVTLQHYEERIKVLER
ncbi:MAG: hypothetical protein A3C02_01315 [Candidatus Andersenbacteria bacterium RIFCSPHIGHO2_02_FULL_45_11]|uniref:Uncharacterized protein n=1 Tax=Candidatus Andersenbacteria bacterium RIFCSPHIGHO2_12_FULL_45_11 TaxID=1797281 RepID=A0A1G1X333_9BACT|nr:MAG: hypothetical protein A2805_00095 [Candidatus Andersenbacteria bacterium RIFCSPHIGHO2_01_FULL_46_36]OGY34364.1 MAG: hypothetical protein A3D99_02525 [Candidatus Andersenbacteria bacterium RIFCSPHIGHO2_12_FULL_45_11]OGY34943.1 MAG: hypothetical protein A3C02_01315 [Candidatus Andersenbacteria bacterium RIFCSPHIGHO2_02_FULL_45_11]